MRDAVDVIKNAVVAWYDTLIVLFVINLAILLLSLTVVLLPPAIAALYYFTGELAHGRGNGISDYFGAMRQYFIASWRWGLLNVIVVGLLMVNVNFYRRWDASWAFVLQVFFYALAFYWTLLQLYVLPFLFELKDFSLRMALRNAFFTAMASPLFSLIMLLSILIIAANAILLFPLILVTIPLMAAIGSFAIRNRVEHFTGGTPDPEESSTA